MFAPWKYANFVSQASLAQARLFHQHSPPSRDDFDLVIIGSGIGGGLLADDLADRHGGSKRILVLEAGSFLYPTHVYNLCRFPNGDVAEQFGCGTFHQGARGEQSEFFVARTPQINFGGRSIFWSGLIPTPQPWELDFFPAAVTADFQSGDLLAEAGRRMNASRSMGVKAQQMVAQLQGSPLAAHFVIEETPRALHQPYLKPDGTPADKFFTEPTGVFNTAELLLNQAGFAGKPKDPNGAGLHLRLNQFVEDIQAHAGGWFEIISRNTLDGVAHHFWTRTAVLAAGSLESAKLIRRSRVVHGLPHKHQLGRGLTDHPVTSELNAAITHCGGIAVEKTDHAKIILYSKGLRDGAGQIIYPFNIEVNVNHEYWHMRENDPVPGVGVAKESTLQLKFSFGNCLDDGNAIGLPEPFGYVPEVWMRNLNWTDDLCAQRFPKLAGWRKNAGEVFALLQGVAQQVFQQFSFHGSPAQSSMGLRFGTGTVHHAAGSLRMPYRRSYDSPFQTDSVVDADLRVNGTDGLYVCDMSVMPYSSAANPVRALAALALRLSKHLAA